MRIVLGLVLLSFAACDNSKQKAPDMSKFDEKVELKEAAKAPTLPPPPKN